MQLHFVKVQAMVFRVVTPCCDV